MVLEFVAECDPDASSPHAGSPAAAGAFGAFGTESGPAGFGSGVAGASPWLSCQYSHRRAGSGGRWQRLAATVLSGGRTSCYAGSCPLRPTLGYFDDELDFCRVTCDRSVALSGVYISSYEHYLLSLTPPFVADHQRVRSASGVCCGQWRPARQPCPCACANGEFLMD